MMDLDSNSNSHVISQSIPITTSGQYLLSVEWFPAVTNPLGKDFKITINSTLFTTVTVNSNNYIHHQEEYIVNSTVGNLNISIEMVTPTADSHSTNIVKVNLQELIPIPTPPAPESEETQLEMLLFS